jgi:hypothetical protein
MSATARDIGGDASETMHLKSKIKSKIMTDTQILKIANRIDDIHENIKKLLEVQFGPPQLINGSTLVFRTIPNERTKKTKAVSLAWEAFVNHEDADHMSSYALAGVIGVSQPWANHMINCRKELIRRGDDPTTVPWHEARPVLKR